MAIAAMGLIGGSVTGCTSNGSQSTGGRSCLFGTWDLDFVASAEANSTADTTTGNHTIIFDDDTVIVQVDVSSSVKTVVEGVEATVDQSIKGSAEQRYSVHGSELNYGEVVWTKGSGTTTVAKGGETTTDEQDFTPTPDTTVEMGCESDKLILTNTPESDVTAGIATVEQIFTRR
ncbi:hypothetical protein E3O53_01400 [Cryobacterium sp. TMT2-18-3]|uniref:hypothetical protein n=1 Tax=unclassified Cryobacterium TaxID=2649013 RepID=UPI001068F018|nr:MULTISPECIES: hypothetical protein [unclassified Cryobacterium]TFC32190.1 hypothetical protein E3O22_00330 [Cryobacterium sp. TMT2-18-2]TFC67841.1 hypothetical protein E3O53_01400 [Cryobacterium sp. TMT2-18-3]